MEDIWDNSEMAALMETGHLSSMMVKNKKENSLMDCSMENRKLNSDMVTHSGEKSKIGMYTGLGKWSMKMVMYILEILETGLRMEMASCYIKMGMLMKGNFSMTKNMGLENSS